MPGIRILLALIIAQLLGPAYSTENTLVLPPDHENQPGFGFARSLDESGQRTLSVYDPSQLIEAMPQGAMITGIAFRPEERDDITVSLRAVIPSIEIRMSTSPNSVLFQRDRFSDFIGADVTTVYPRAPSNWMPQAFPIRAAHLVML